MATEVGYTVTIKVNIVCVPKEDEPDPRYQQELEDHYRNLSQTDVLEILEQSFPKTSDLIKDHLVQSVEFYEKV